MAISLVVDSDLRDVDSNSYLNGLSSISWCVWIKADASMIGTDTGWLIAENPIGDDQFLSNRFDAVGLATSNIRCLKFGLYLSSGSHNIETAAETQTTDWLHVSVG